MEKIITLLVSPLGIVLTLIVIVGICLVLILLKSILNRRSFKLGKFEMGKEKNSSEFKRLFNLVLPRVLDLSYKKWQYLYIDRLEAQLSFAEQRFIEVKGTLTEIYREVYKEKYHNDACYEHVAFYSSLIHVTFDIKIKQFFKEGFIKNHYTEMNEDKFNGYIKDKIDVVMHLLREQLDTSYLPQNNINAQEIISRIELKQSVIVDSVKAIFNNARSLSKEYQEMSNKLDEEIVSITDSIE